ncbi:hypothetical protein ABVT39_014368 [Epinephelus coioides]
MALTAYLVPRCSELKKQKADASVIKTIKPAAAPSAIVRDRSNEWKKELRRNFEKVAVCRHTFSITQNANNLQIHKSAPSPASCVARAGEDKWLGSVYGQ